MTSLCTHEDECLTSLFYDLQKPDAAYDAKNLATFIKLSNKTGFSRKKLRQLFRQWSAFTKEDMPKGTVHILFCLFSSSSLHPLFILFSLI